ncbi:MAG: transglutaminase-like domain-containing protein [Ignavibacteria bacterium]|nr:transglutaminase-like domain-containing protein [Ignavibacteria bacterium]
MIETTESAIPENQELDYLIKLLDDEDENIYSNVRERFIFHGKNSTDYLENYLSNILNAENILINKRANEIISTLNYDKLEIELKNIIQNGGSDMLEDAMLTIASFGYPMINKKEYKNKLERLASEIRSRLSVTNPVISEIYPLNVLELISKYLYKELGFKGNTKNYYEPDNSYINKVIDTRSGNPISLSVVYLLIAKRLNLPVYGINMPGHFILKYESGKAGEEYFIDPFNKGVLISVREASEYIKNSGSSNEEFIDIPYLKGANENEILLRVMRNLIEAYKKENEESKSLQLEKLMLCFV